MHVAIVPVTSYEQNCSILSCEATREAAIVDPGGDLDRIAAKIAELGVRPVKILLTHGHHDHCAAARQFAEQLGVPIEGPHEADRFWLERMPELTRSRGFPHANAFEPDRWLQDGDTVTFGQQTLQVIHCPGHTPGHVVFYHAGDRIAFVGDVLFAGSIGRTDFPRGNRADLIASIRGKLWPLGDDVRFVPGHGPMSTFGQERRTNPYVGDGR